MYAAMLCLALLASPPAAREASGGGLGLLACTEFAAPVCGVVSQPNAQQVRWEKRDLTWAIESPPPPGWNEAQVRAELVAAFKVWSDACGLTFREIPPSAGADIRVRFAKGKHAQAPYTARDDPSFDGPARVLAHAFYPGPDIGGDAHFDTAERWALAGTDAGLILRSTMIHEIGHSLGLDHDESDPDSIMFPSYTGAIRLGGLDAARIAARYGPPPRPAPVPDPIPGAFHLEREGTTGAAARESWEAPGPGTYRVELAGAGLAWRLERDGRRPGPWQTTPRSITCDDAGTWAIGIRGSGAYRLRVSRE